MKRVKIYFLLTFLLCVISCNDNDKGDPNDYVHPYAYIEGVFPDYAIGRELVLVYNGDTLTNKKVDFVSLGLDKPKAILTFENVIGGEAKTILTVDLVESKNPDDDDILRLMFDGIYSKQSSSIKYSGFIEPLHMLLELEEE